MSFAKREGYAVMHDCLVSDVLSIFRKIKFPLGLVTIGMEELTSYTAHTPQSGVHAQSTCTAGENCHTRTSKFEYTFTATLVLNEVYL